MNLSQGGEPPLRVKSSGSLEGRIGTLDGLLTEAFVALMRMAEEFAAAGGELALVAARDHLNGLNTESSELTATLPDLERQASTEAIRLIRLAVRFVQAGGRDRLVVVGDEIGNVERDQEALRTSLPRFRSRRDAKRRELDRDISAAEQRIDELDKIISDLSGRINAADGYARRVDKVVTSLIDGWKQARQAIADAELSAESIAAAPRSAILETARAAVNALRAATEWGDDPLIHAVEEVEADVRKFALTGRISRINDARRLKDSAWNAYAKGVDSLRADKAFSLSDTDRALLEDALSPSGLRYVTDIFSAYEKHLARQADLYEQARQDMGPSLSTRRIDKR